MKLYDNDIATRRLARSIGRQGWPIEEVAQVLSTTPKELPTQVWDAHEQGMNEFLDQPEASGPRRRP